MSELTVEIVQAAIEGGSSLAEFCVIHNLPYHSTYRWCRGNGIKLSRATNGKSTRTLLARKRHRVFTDADIEQLHDLYVVQHLSLREISEQFNTTRATVSATLKRFGIAVRLKNGRYEKISPKHPQALLTELYVTRQLSADEIRHTLPGYNNATDVVEDLKKCGIERRSYKEAGRLLYEKRPEKRELHRRQFYERAKNTEHRTTSLEREFMDWAELNDVLYRFQFQIEPTWHRYDFLIEGTNIIVEMDGDFWHSQPEHVVRDARFDKTAAEHGYTVVRIRESVVKSNPNVFNEVLLPLLEMKK